MTLAGISAVAAGITLLISGACLVVFFAADKDAWGRANDATSALFALLTIAPALSLAGRYASDARLAVGVATVLAIGGALDIAVTSGLTAASRLDWLLSAKIGAVGFAGLLIWIATVCVLILANGGLPRALAWLGLAAVGLAAIGAVFTIRFIHRHGSLSGEVQPSPALWVLFALAYLSFPVWFVWLGRSSS